MAIISVTPEQLQEQAGVYLRSKDQIEEAIQVVNAMNGQISQEWKGQAFTAYLEQYQELYTQVKKFEDLLESIHGQLVHYAQTMAERDQQDASQFGLK